ncbi:hypothetical protein Agub_g2934 [Astrephomene gubernaculifera]|uniref:Uncharacterized protein n=1 Tax=Astrephomene gubernaculifera TaxID=47775 RepID=A0AAD3DJW3_9CHLO|nr:hypothetical protein Agub_g2934 [Astrephomene gubernaculifera]
MGAQQSSIAGTGTRGNPAGAHEAMVVNDASSVKAHAIDCCSIASSYQSLSELDDFLKPGGDPSLGRYSVRSLAAASEIVANTIYEGDELHTLAEEEAEHSQDRSGSRGRPAASATTTSVSPAVQLTNGSNGASAPASEDPAAAVATLVASVFAAVRAAHSSAALPAGTTAATAVVPLAADDCPAAFGRSLAPAPSAALSVSTQVTTASDLAPGVSAIIATACPTAAQPAAKTALPPGTPAPTTGEAPAPACTPPSVRPSLEAAASLASAWSSDPQPSILSPGSASPFSTPSPAAAGTAATSPCGSFGSCTTTAGEGDGKMAAAEVPTEAATAGSVTAAAPPCMSGRLRSHRVADLSVSFSEDGGDTEEAAAAGAATSGAGASGDRVRQSPAGSVQPACGGGGGGGSSLESDAAVAHHQHADRSTGRLAALNAGLASISRSLSRSLSRSISRSISRGSPGPGVSEVRLVLDPVEPGVIAPRVADAAAGAPAAGKDAGVAAAAAAAAPAARSAAAATSSGGATSRNAPRSTKATEGKVSAAAVIGAVRKAGGVAKAGGTAGRTAAAGKGAAADGGKARQPSSPPGKVGKVPSFSCFACFSPEV